METVVAKYIWLTFVARLTHSSSYNFSSQIADAQTMAQDCEKKKL